MFSTSSSARVRRDSKIHINTAASEQFSQNSSQRSIRLAQLAKEAREVLKPWTKVPTEKLSIFDDKIFNNDLKQHEGVGVLLRMARVDPKSTGNISPAEEAEFLRSMMTLVDEILGFFSTAMIINTLTLAIGIPLTLHEITVPSFESATLAGTEDSGGFAFYLTHFRDPTLMHVFHWIELLLLSVSIWKSSSGILSSFLLSATFSIYLPDQESKLRFVIKRRAELLKAFEGTMWSIITLLGALPFAAAKFSPVGCMVLGIPVIGVHVDFFRVLLPSVGTPVMVYQHLLTKELFEEETDDARGSQQEGCSNFTPQKTPKEKKGFNFFGSGSKK
ncbi:hypothetical protein TrST_g7367 [Triparma strigata]|uniref:Uncharacterized protein n=1 Tax=Triparma strigata TaxID=1606541 RepID=A0A9W7EZA4_9STRA|nr:hypothetical protein TrST_g7367 [Triparma strigata]